MNEVRTNPFFGGGPLGAGAGPLPGDSLRLPPIRQYLRIVSRWRITIVAAVLVCVLLGTIVTLLMTRQYTAWSEIEIARESNKITNIQGVEQDASDADQEFYQTQYGLLRSRSLAERVAAQLGFDRDPSFFKMFRIKGGDELNLDTNGHFAQTGREERLRLVGVALLKHLSVTPTRLSRLVDIGFTSPDALLSQKVANAWSTDFIQASLQRRYEATSYARNFLESHLEQARLKLEASERAQVAYATRERIINLPAAGGGQSDNRGAERPLEADDLAALNASLSQAMADRIQAQARYEQGGNLNGGSSEALQNEAINGLRQKRADVAADYQKLLTQFRPSYPAAVALKSQLDQLDRSIASEEGRVSNSLGANYRAAREREVKLSDKVKSLTADLLDLRRRSIQYNIYQREVDTNRTLYDGLLQRYKEIGVAGGVGVNNISVVDPADLPDKPSSPRLLLNLMLSLIAGGVIGSVAAYLREQNDEAISDPTEIETALGIPLLGSIPVITDATPDEALEDRKSRLVDAYLAVQANLAFSTEHGLPRSFAITSSRPAEGKSTTALALATLLARGGKNVVLLDADLRAPSLHRIAGVSHDVGLSNYLAGNDDIESLMVKIERFGFMMMAAGPLPPNAAELLTGNRLKGLIDRLLKVYDHVIIDAPPVMGLADAPLIGSRVEGVIYAVEAHGIRSSAVRTAVNRLYSGNVRIIGAVLTKFEAKRAHLGYDYDYGYSYGHDRKKET